MESTEWEAIPACLLSSQERNLEISGGLSKVTELQGRVSQNSGRGCFECDMSAGVLSVLEVSVMFPRTKQLKLPPPVFMEHRRKTSSSCWS